MSSAAYPALMTLGCIGLGLVFGVLEALADRVERVESVRRGQRLAAELLADARFMPWPVAGRLVDPTPRSEVGGSGACPELPIADVVGGLVGLAIGVVLLELLGFVSFPNGFSWIIAGSLAVAIVLPSIPG